MDGIIHFAQIKELEDMNTALKVDDNKKQALNVNIARLKSKFVIRMTK